MSAHGFPHGNGGPPFGRGSALPVTLSPAGLADATALAPAIPPTRSPNGRRPAEVLASLARERVLLSATDARGALAGLATLRRHPHGLLLGWAVLPDRVGESLGLRIAEAGTARALAMGAPEVLCQAGARNLHARQVLEALGYGLKLLVPGSPALYAADTASFAARGGVTGAAVPASAEACAPVHPAEWRARVPTPCERLWEPLRTDDLSVRRAGPGDEAAVARLMPYGIVPIAAPAVVDAFLARVMEEQAVMLGIARGGEVVGSVNVSVGPRGGYEIGWCVDEDHRGRGHASAIASAVMARLFEAGVPEISCAIDPWNAPSLRTAARLGFEAGRPGPDGTLHLSLSAESFEADLAPAMAAAA